MKKVGRINFQTEVVLHANLGKGQIRLPWLGYPSGRSEVKVGIKGLGLSTVPTAVIRNLDGRPLLIGVCGVMALPLEAKISRHVFRKYQDMLRIAYRMLESQQGPELRVFQRNH